MAPATVNLLEYMRSKSQIDVDSLDPQVSTELGPFADGTSNQADAYMELLRPCNAAILKKSAALSRQIKSEFPVVTFEELAMEIAMLYLALMVVPNVTGAVHVMANPLYSYSTPRIVDNGQRLYRLCHRLDPSFDTSRLIIKVSSTWEGLQACRKLKATGVKTLATTLFTMEQAVLAGEVGCISISPFVHELKVHFDESYQDVDPLFDLCVQAQQYYQEHSIPTRVKACSVVTVDEVLQLAGVAAFTVPPELLRELSTTDGLQEELEARSVFLEDTASKRIIERQTYVNDQEKFKRDFASNGQGQAKTEQAIDIFCDFQVKAEAMMRDADLTHIG